MLYFNRRVTKMLCSYFDNLPTRRRRPILRSVAVSLLVLVFSFMQLAAALHQHGECVAVVGFSTPRCALSTASAGAAAQSVQNAALGVPGPNRAALCTSDCPLCEFAALSAAPPAPVVVPNFAPRLAAVPAPALRSQPFVRFRFCDRSPARAPPSFA